MKLTFSFKTLILLALIAISTLAVITTSNAQASTWQLTINGLVDHPVVLTLEDLKAMPQTTEEASIYCVDFPQYTVAAGKWTGVSLATLLQSAGVQSSAVKVAFFATDGYTTDLDLNTATKGDVIVAYTLDSTSLNEVLRLVVPGRWGYKWINQLTTITLMDYDYKGRWESQGYSDDGIAHLDSAVARSPISQPLPNPTSAPTNKTTATSPNPIGENTSSTTPPQNTQNTKPELEPQPQGGEPITLEIAAAVGIAVVVVSTVFVMRRRHLNVTH
jgi:hypothetical protein